MAARSIFIPLIFTLYHLLIISINVAGQAASGGASPTASPTAATGGASPAASPTAAAGGSTEFDISKLGAKPGGDATQALMDAWKSACEATSPSKVTVPTGTYLLGPVKLSGPCKSNVTIEINGNFKAPAHPADMHGQDFWFKLTTANNVTMKASQGGGVFDGQGEKAWTMNICSKNVNCNTLPYNFRFEFLNNSEISGISSLNSKLFHMAVFGCNGLNMHGLNISAPGNSPNTDGIHLGRSDGVNITETTIGTGDDCISVGDGIKNLYVEGVTCGPGHGISVGSLGRYQNEEPVENVTVKNCVIKNADNGVRIKTWHDSYESHVKNMFFEDIVVENVWYPILVDQEYCPWNHCKAKTPSKVKITDVRFKNVTGTSTRKEAVKLVCSSAIPCERVELIDIDLASNGTEGPAVSMCKFVKPTVSGKMNPTACNAPASPSA